MRFKTLLHLDLICSMCGFHVSLESKTSPRYFTVSDFWIIEFLRRRTGGREVCEFVKWIIDVLLEENLKPF